MITGYHSSLQHFFPSHNHSNRRIEDPNEAGALHFWKPNSNSILIYCSMYQKFYPYPFPSYPVSYIILQRVRGVRSHTKWLFPGMPGDARSEPCTALPPGPYITGSGECFLAQCAEVWAGLYKLPHIAARCDEMTLFCFPDTICFLLPLFHIQQHLQNAC
ncbi:hypothetical protein AVEN_33999-1 [Araneus ventricosus]|uniref:Uncharacterized protein n=1 Tax=Araneus ventricosus TaxID=182803 RepID=A0A4Y2E580_ARAVE|nr:hypothetical protein AVEN_33999-1 [Araneus ventricosus]